MTEQIKHFLIPEHRILSEKEEKELLKELGVSKENLPKIKKTDPAIVHLKPKPGSIIEIKRRSFTTKESIYYRVVVD